ncbi:MAG: glutaredoxin family protein [Myxococcota bacterium]
MKTLTLYLRRTCCLCRSAREVVQQVRQQHPFELVERDVDRDLSPDDPRKSPYAIEIPVVEIDGQVVCRHVVSAEALEKILAERGDA